MTAKTDAARIQRLHELGDQVDALRRETEDICKDAASEIRQAQLAGRRERRIHTTVVTHERRWKP